MKAGDVVLIRFPQGPGASKLRPALVLAILPGAYQDALVCGISTQLTSETIGWDERLKPADSDYGESGVHRESLICLSYLASIFRRDISGIIGTIGPNRLETLQQRLSQFLVQ